MYGRSSEELAHTFVNDIEASARGEVDEVGGRLEGIFDMSAHELGSSAVSKDGECIFLFEDKNSRGSSPDKYIQGKKRGRFGGLCRVSELRHQCW